MNKREIRDHKFKILFSYYFNENNIDNVLLNYFDLYPYESEEDKNEYIGDTKKTLKSIHKIEEDNKTVENESDKAITLDIEDNIREIKQKTKEIVEKTKDIDELISKNLDSWDIERVGKAELTIIRLAIYEMYFDAAMDLKVAINEAVELAKIYGDDKADKFINGVLATIYKNKQ